MNDLIDAVGATQASTPNDTVLLVKDFYKVADARPFKFSDLTAFYAADFVDHHPNPAIPSDAPYGLLYQLLAEGAPDSVHNIDMILPSGDDTAIVVWSYEGTNTDALFQIPAQAPALPFTIAGIEIWRSKDGKFTEMWHVEDIAGLMQQLSAK
tara:strand:+ start:2203 stop:2661 length:459 start_codon:yes stop_codon:yes gene_type:complete